MPVFSSYSEINSLYTPKFYRLFAGVTLRCLFTRKIQAKSTDIWIVWLCGDTIGQRISHCWRS